jgi:hypothetical protein
MAAPVTYTRRFAGASCVARLVGTHEDDRDVVAPALGVGRVDELFHDDLDVGSRREDLGDLGVGHHLREAVGAEQVAIAGLRRIDEDVDLHPRSNADCATEVVAHRARDTLRAERVVDREQGQLSRAPAVAAAVSDVGDVDAARVGGEPSGDDGGPHSSVGRVALRFPEDATVGGLDRSHESIGQGGTLGARLDGHAFIGGGRRHHLDGQPAGQIASCVSAHAIRNREEARAGRDRERVFVSRLSSSRVRLTCGRNDELGLNFIGVCERRIQTASEEHVRLALLDGTVVVAVRQRRQSRDACAQGLAKDQRDLGVLLRPLARAAAWRRLRLRASELAGDEDDQDHEHDRGRDGDHRRGRIECAESRDYALQHASSPESTSRVAGRVIGENP